MRYEAGYFTVENAPRLVDAMRELLTDTLYTFTAYNDGFSVESSIGLESRLDRLAPEKSTTDEAMILSIHDYPKGVGGGQFAALTVNDLYGVWGVSGDDSYVSIDGRRILIKHKAGAGHNLIWKIAPVPAYIYRGFTKGGLD
jgi:hypothetical protein